MSDRSRAPAHDRDARRGGSRSPANHRRTPAPARRVPCRTGRAQQRIRRAHRTQAATIDVLKAMSASPAIRSRCSTDRPQGARSVQHHDTLACTNSMVNSSICDQARASRHTARPRQWKPTSGCFRWCRRAVPSLAGRFSTGRSFMCATWRPNPESRRPFAISVTSRRYRCRCCATARRSARWQWRVQRSAASPTARSHCCKPSPSRR